ncbi:MAG: ATPase [Rhodobacteraceae bacterium]|nr:ATPase [Paracoccaceae bacterium]
MKNSLQTCIIGVDGGGTSCRVALLYRQQRFEVVLGQANATTNLLAAVATVQSGIDQLVSRAKVSPEDRASCQAHVALAGVLQDKDAQEIAARLTITRVRVSDDRVSTVVGALGDDTGVVVGIGTGSFLARQSGTQMQFVGGWGLHIGDEASGAWLGKGLLAATLHSVDGIGSSSELTNGCLRRFGDANKIVSFASSATPSDFSEFAPDVAAAAGNGDEVGKALMMQGADYITHGLKQLGWVPDEPICLTGGVAPAYTSWLPADMVSCIRAAKGTALDGALKLASKAAAKVKAQGQTT